MTTHLDRALVGGMVLGAMIWASALAAEPELVWELEGFKQPESAVFDAEREVLYVSNIDGGPMDKDGKGQIAKVAPDGSLVEAEWVTGLDAPKGMALDGGTLYVSDIDRLVAIDVEAGEVAERHQAPDAQFLNDVTADAEGRIYVSDMMDNTIWRLADGSFEVWLKDEALEQPNGLLAEEDRIVVGAWGVMTDGFATKTPGHLKAVDLETKEVSSLGEGEPVGNLDGVEPDGQGNYLVTDWTAGALLRIDPAGGAEQLLDLDQGSADLEYIADQQLAIVPMMNDDKLVAYRIE
jgi:sugar lactone lactonase YvrE